MIKILSVAEFWFTHEKSRNVTNSKLDWAVVFTARYVRRKGKTVDFGARLRKPSKAVADLLGNHECDIPGDGSRSIRLQGPWCGFVYGCCQLTLGFKAASSKPNPIST